MPPYTLGKEGWEYGYDYNIFFSLGESMNTIPHYYKLHILRDCRGQYIWSAMDKPHPKKTTFVIMVSPQPGKYQ